MRIVRLRKDGQDAFFALDEGAAASGGTARRLDRGPFEGGAPAGPPLTFSAGELLAPVAPSKILCVGRNYAAHAKELGNEVPKEPLLFLKPPSSILAPGGVVVLPPESERVEHEAELAVVIGQRVRRVSRERAMDAVFGYTCACDVTARDLQKKDGQWARAKGFDTFCPIGPWIETALDPRDLGVRCSVSGAQRQDGRTSAMIFDVATVVAYASAAFTLEPGDVILTGTPEGVGPLADGDALSVAIEGIGELAVTVRADGAA
jgi:2-keto-4-pentenoate hydratase/2-oxohepta-3-ene-1,7-dioic acid hydratase in catechol pathway